jgi:hypothetical protein
MTSLCIRLPEKKSYSKQKYQKGKNIAPLISVPCSLQTPDRKKAREDTARK